MACAGAVAAGEGTGLGDQYPPSLQKVVPKPLDGFQEAGFHQIKHPRDTAQINTGGQGPSFSVRQEFVGTSYLPVFKDLFIFI